jgi:dolichol-phosphate mannosyltransferase
MDRLTSIEISVVVPIYNEEETIPELYRRLSGVFEKLGRAHEIIFVDDGSTDGSFELLRRLHERDHAVRLIRFSRNFGHQVAVTAGVDHASGDAIVIIDGDLQDPPETIPALIDKWQEGYDVVYAVRSRRQGESKVKAATASVFYRILKRLANIDVPVDSGDFRLISRRVAASLVSLRERNRYIRGLTSWIGYSQAGVTYERAKRYAGQTKYPLRKMIKFALDGVTSFSFVPLQLATVIGLCVAALCLAYLSYVVYLAVFSDVTVRGWPSTMVAILFLGAVQLIAIGIIGEYLGRIYDEVKQRPLYIIGEIVGFETAIRSEQNALASHETEVRV